MATTGSHGRGRTSLLWTDRTVEMAKRILSALGTDYSHTLLKHIRAGDYLAVVKAPMPNPSLYDSADTFSKDWLAYNLLRKNPDLKVKGIDRKQACWQAFEESEASNLETNVRLLWSTDQRLTNGAGVDAVFLTAQRKIRETLGRFSWDKVLPYMGHSSGATAGMPRVFGAHVYKYRLRLEATISALPYVIAAIGQDPLWVQQSIRLHGIDPQLWVDVALGERLDDVEKNALTKRTIGIQPSGNLFVQRGFGGYMRKALRRKGIDLNDQTINQRLALIGSLTDRLTTWDGKNASNSVSLGLIQRLLRDDPTGVLSEWYEHLNNVRCHFGVHKSGKLHKYQMFSAMGNGFTFELESLIFWAFAEAVAEHRGVDATISVYGDDVILDDVLTEDFIRVMRHAGFASNVEKTFSSGPFRESCGKHYFRGRDVTPFAIDEAVDNPVRYAWLFNSIRIWLSHEHDPSVAHLWSKFISSLKRSERRFVDSNHASNGFLADEHEAFAFQGMYQKRGWRLHQSEKAGYSGTHAYLACPKRSPGAPSINAPEFPNHMFLVMDLLPCPNRHIVEGMRPARNSLPKRYAKVVVRDAGLQRVGHSSVPEVLYPLRPLST